VLRVPDWGHIALAKYIIHWTIYQHTCPNLLGGLEAAESGFF
jgi:hypothetical protein